MEQNRGVSRAAFMPPYPTPHTSWLAQQRKGIVQEAQGGLQLCAVAQVEAGRPTEQQVEGQHEQDAGQPLRPLPRLHSGWCEGDAVTVCVQGRACSHAVMRD